MKKMNILYFFVCLLFSLTSNIAYASVATKDYIVIGGGVSGLAACVELIKNGVPASKIKLLEASNRLGGRIYSQPFSKYIFT